MHWQGIAKKFLPLAALRALASSGSAWRSGRRQRNIAVMFVDIEGCTRLCEDLSPNEMTRLIETYFARYLDIIRGEGGEVTEVLGDGLLALFEGPSLQEDTARAFRAALRIRQSTAELNALERDRHDPIVVNIGLNAGAGLVGITRLRGRSGERWVYAARGSVTNIAARLCGLATGGQILVSATAAEQIGDVYRLRALGPRVLKNVSSAVQVFEVLLAQGSREPRSVPTRRK